MKLVGQKCRAIAEAIDDLLGVDRPTVNETSLTATKIRRSMAKKRKKVKVKKGKKNIPWQHRPENAKKLAKWKKSMKRGRKKARKNKTPRTQTPRVEAPASVM